MKKTLFIVVTIAIAALFHCYDMAEAREEVCDFALLMQNSGVHATLEQHKGERIYGDGILKDIEKSNFSLCTYTIRVSCNGINVMVYLSADYNRARTVGSKVSFEGEISGSEGWKEFLGNHEPYIDLSVKRGRISWAD